MVSMNGSLPPCNFDTPTKVFSFQRVKCETFQDEAQLYLNKAAEILVNNDHEMYQTVLNYYDFDMLNNSNNNNDNNNDYNDNKNNNKNDEKHD